MKKGVFIMIVLMLVGGVSFAGPIKPDGTDSLNHSILVELVSNSELSVYDFGFSSTPVSQWATQATHFTTAGLTLKPKINVDGSITANLESSGSDGLYVYWRISAFAGVKLSLSLSAANDGYLTNTAGDPLGWSVSWYYDDSASSVQSKQYVKQELFTSRNKIVNGVPTAELVKNLGPLPVAVYPNQSILQGTAGSVPINIVTDSLVAKSIDDAYTGELILTIEPLEGSK